MFANEISFCVSIWYPAEEFTLAGTFMADAPTNNLYLFLFNPRAEIRNEAVNIDIPVLGHSYYWSFQRDGSEPLSAEMLDRTAPPHVFFQCVLWGKSWQEGEYRVIKEFCLTKGISLENTDMAMQLGYPLAVMHDKPVLLNGACPSLIASSLPSQR